MLAVRRRRATRRRSARGGSARRRSNGLGDHVGGRELKEIEVRRDRRSRGGRRDGERDVAVEARVRRSQRPCEPVVRALAEEKARSLVEHRGPRTLGEDCPAYPHGNLVPVY